MADSVTRLHAEVSRLALYRPVVVAVDDLEWCDASSAAALVYLARRTMPGRILLLAATSPHGARHETGAADELMAEPTARVLHLRPLPPEQRVAPGPPTGPPTAARIGRGLSISHGGKPLFARFPSSRTAPASHARPRHVREHDRHPGPARGRPVHPPAARRRARPVAANPPGDRPPRRRCRPDVSSRDRRSRSRRGRPGGRRDGRPLAAAPRRRLPVPLPARAVDGVRGDAAGDPGPGARPGGPGFGRPAGPRRGGGAAPGAHRTGRRPPGRSSSSRGVPTSSSPPDRRSWPCNASGACCESTSTTCPRPAARLPPPPPSRASWPRRPDSPTCGRPWSSRPMPATSPSRPSTWAAPSPRAPSAPNWRCCCPRSPGGSTTVTAAPRRSGCVSSWPRRRSGRSPTRRVRGSSRHLLGGRRTGASRIERQALAQLAAVYAQRRAPMECRCRGQARTAAGRHGQSRRDRPDRRPPLDPSPGDARPSRSVRARRHPGAAGPGGGHGAWRRGRLPRTDERAGIRAPAPGFPGAGGGRVPPHPVARRQPGHSRHPGGVRSRAAGSGRPGRSPGRTWSTGRGSPSPRGWADPPELPRSRHARAPGQVACRGR